MWESARCVNIVNKDEENDYEKDIWKNSRTFLCLGMVLGLMPSQALQVFAEGETTPNYLTFTAEEAGSTLSFTWNTEESVEISKDSGTNWTTYVKGTKITLAKVDDSVQFRGELTKLNINTYINPAFTMTGKIAASGSITSLKDGNGGNPDTVASGFGGMFMNCDGLTQAPELPSKSVVNGGYERMFENCTSLVEAPKLPATTLGYDAYTSMFSGCTNMKTGPSTLPATALNIACYSNMFRDCKSLIKSSRTASNDIDTGLLFWHVSGMYIATANSKSASYKISARLL